MADPIDNVKEEKYQNKNEPSMNLRQGISHLIAYVDKLFDIENQRFIVGLNSCIVAAIIATSYRSPRLAPAARIVLPPVCGITGAKSWEILITRKLESKELDCSVCTNLRGLTLAVFSACILPATVSAAVVARKRPGLLRKVEKFTESFSDVLFQSPLMLAAILMQSCLGFLMASREYELKLKEKLGKLEIKNAEEID